MNVVVLAVLVVYMVAVAVKVGMWAYWVVGEVLTLKALDHTACYHLVHHNPQPEQRRLWTDSMRL